MEGDGLQSQAELLALTRAFLRQVKAADPARYREVCRRYAVNQNIRRDEKAHEVEGGLDGELSGVDALIYRRWSSEAWD